MDPSVVALRDTDQERIREQRRRGEPVVDAQHGPQRAPVDEERVDEREGAEADQHGHVLEVVRRPRHEIARPPGLVELGGEGQEMAEQVRPDRRLDTLPGAQQEEPGGRSRYRLEEGEPDDPEGSGHGGSSRPGCARAQDLDGALHHPRDGERAEGGGDEEAEPDDIASPVSRHVAKEDPHGHRDELYRRCARDARPAACEPTAPPGLARPVVPSSR